MTEPVRRGLTLSGQVAAVAALVWLVTSPARVTPLRIATVTAFVVVALRTTLLVSGGRRPEPRLRTVPVELGPPGEQRVRLARLETSLTYASTSARQYDRTVRPLLRDLVADRLARNRGIDVTTSPAAARAVLGEELWQLFQVGPPRADALPGPTPEEIARLVALAEAV